MYFSKSSSHFVFFVFKFFSKILIVACLFVILLLVSHQLLHPYKNGKKIGLHTVLITLMMKAVTTFGTSVNFCQNTRRNFPEDKSLSRLPLRKPEISL
jgi:uncharacterized membrane protein YbhN (UPF0104 family)